MVEIDPDAPVEAPWELRLQRALAETERPYFLLIVDLPGLQPNQPVPDAGDLPMRLLNTIADEHVASLLRSAADVMERRKR